MDGSMVKSWSRLVSIRVASSGVKHLSCNIIVLVHVEGVHVYMWLSALLRAIFMQSVITVALWAQELCGVFALFAQSLCSKPKARDVSPFGSLLLCRDGLRAVSAAARCRVRGAFKLDEPCGWQSDRSAASAGERHSRSLWQRNAARLLEHVQ